MMGVRVSFADLECIVTAEIEWDQAVAEQMAAVARQTVIYSNANLCTILDHTADIDE